MDILALSEKKKDSVSERKDQSILRWFGYVERIGDDRLAKKVY